MRRSTAVRLGLVLATVAGLVVALSLGLTGPDKPQVGGALANGSSQIENARKKPVAEVFIVAPKRRGPVWGKVKFRAKVITRRKLSRVEFFIDGKRGFTDRSAPYAFKGPKGRWNTAKFKVGTHKLFVVAYDRRGRRIGAKRRYVRVVRKARGTVPGAPGAPARRSSSAPGIPSPYAPPEIDGPASVFVATNGSDAAPCTRAAPCRTFGRAYRVARPGQIVEVAGGTYPQQTIPVDPSKTSGPYVILRPKAGESVRLVRQSSNVDDLAVYGRFVEVRNMALSHDFYVNVGADNVVMRNLDVELFFIVSASNVYVVGGDIGPIHNGASSIKPRSSSDPKPRNIVVDGAYFHDYTRDPGVHMECLQAWSIDGFTLRNSVFTRCGVFDVFVSSLFQEITNNALIENNFFDDSVGGGQSVAVAATNTTVRYNSILGSLSFDPSSRNIDVIGNVLVGGGCQSNVNYEYNVSANFKCSPTDLRASPGFVRPVEGDMDLHLGPGSPAVGRGKPGGFPSYDIDGQSRPLGGAPDAGADER